MNKFICNCVYTAVALFGVFNSEAAYAQAQTIENFDQLIAKSSSTPSVPVDLQKSIEAFYNALMDKNEAKASKLILGWSQERPINIQHSITSRWGMKFMKILEIVPLETSDGAYIFFGAFVDRRGKGIFSPSPAAREDDPPAFQYNFSPNYFLDIWKKTTEGWKVRSVGRGISFKLDLSDLQVDQGWGSQQQFCDVIAIEDQAINNARAKKLP